MIMLLEILETELPPTGNKLMAMSPLISSGAI